MHLSKATQQKATGFVGVKQFNKLVQSLLKLHDRQLFYQLLSTIKPMISRINPLYIENHVQFMDQIIRPFFLFICRPQWNDDRIHIIQDTLKSIIKKIVEINSQSKDIFVNFKIVFELLKTQSFIFCKKKQQTSYYISHINKYQRSSSKSKNTFYKECLENFIAQLCKCPKIIWNMLIEDIIGLIDFLNSCEIDTDIDSNILKLFQLYITEINAYFLSRQPQLTKQISKQKITRLCQILITRFSSKKEIVNSILMIGLNISSSLIKSNSNLQQIEGVKILDTFCYDTWSNRSSKISEIQLIDWLQKNQIFQCLINKNTTQEIFEKGNNILKYFNQSKKETQKIVFALHLVKQNLSQNRKMLTFAFNQLSTYYLKIESKELIYQHIASLSDYISMYFEYLQILEELPARCDRYPNFIEKVFELNLNIVQKAFHLWSDKYKKQMTYVMKRCVDILKREGLNQKNSDQKALLLKQLIFRLLKKFDNSSIYWFSKIIIQYEFYKIILSNNTFQLIMMQIIQKQSFYDRIFQYLNNLNEQSKQQQERGKIVLQVIKFVINKTNSKLDANPKYLNVMVKYPQIYTQILNSSDYSSLEAKIKQLFIQMKTTQNFPFSIFKILFIKFNSEYLQKQNRATYDIKNSESYILRVKPKNIAYFNDMVTLIRQTESINLRQNLAQLIVALFISFSYNKIKKGQEEFLTFTTEVMNNLIEDSQIFLKSNDKKNGLRLLSSLEIFNQILLATDIYGVGDRKPHFSLVSTDSISLTVTNNVTFGNDVQKQICRNFPSNTILFQTLTIIGLAFKCGPQQISLRQGKRLFSHKMNGKTLQELKLNNQQLIAQKNISNSMQTPELISHHSLTDAVCKAVTQIFNRFAYDGKMGIIQCTNFIRQSSGSDCLSNDRRVRQLFEFYDADHDGILLLPDLMHYFYKNLSVQSYYRGNTLKSLENLRYRKNLTLYSEPFDISSKTHLMLRYRSQPLKYYQQLFKLSEANDELISTKSKELLLYLPTYKSKTNQMEKITLLLQSPQFLRHYQLIIIQYELNINNCQTNQQKVIKLQKIQTFISEKKNEKIFSILENYTKKKQKTEMQHKSFIICLKILRNLISISNLAKINFITEQFEASSIPKLPKTSFFATQAKKALSSNNIINFQVVLTLQLTQQIVDLESIIIGCFHKQTEIRQISCNFIYLWQVKTNWKSDLFGVKIQEQYCQQWFKLLSTIIRNCKNLNYQNILTNTITILSQRNEDFNHRYDKLMNGYLNILYSIVFYQKIKLNSAIQKLIIKLLTSTISPTNRSILYDIYALVNEQNCLKYFDQMLTIVRPIQECQIRQKYLGIRNLGSICYMISILQQFFMLQKFKQLVLNRKILKQYKTLQINGKICIDDFMYQLQKMYHNLQSSQKKYYNPNEFCFTCKDYQGNPISPSVQEDAHQFLNRLVQNAENAFKIYGNLENFQKIISSKTLTDIECDQCKNRIEKIQSTYSLMLEVKNQESLESSLKKFTQKQQISDYLCSKCEKKVKKTNKRTYLYELPQMIIFNLQRILYDAHRSERIKVHTSFTFPNEINMQQFIKNRDMENKNTNYRLKGVVIHTGTSEGGHYYSLIKTQGQWYKFNDQNITLFDEKDLARESFGGYESKDGWAQVDYSTNAYILFYERTQIQIPKSIEPKNIFHQQIIEQNFKMIKQLQVHQECFFKAIDKIYRKNRILNIAQKMNSEYFYQGPYQKQICQKNSNMIKIVKKAFFFVSVFSSINYQLKVNIGSYINELCYYMPEQTLALFTQLNVQNLIQNLLFNSDLHYRKITMDVLIRNLLIYLRFYGVNFRVKTQYSEIIINIIEPLLSLINSQHLYSNINKSEQYFQVWRELIKYNLELKEYLINKHNLMFKLLDILMGRQSSYMKYHPKAQDLPNVIVPIVLQTITRLIQLKKNIKGYSVGSLCIYETSSMQAKILLDINLYKRIQKLRYDHELIGKIIVHYSFNCMRYTMMISDFFLSFLNTIQKVDNMDLFFNHLKIFLGIEDQLQRQRYAWIFGVPQLKINKVYGYSSSLPEKSENINYVSGLYINNKIDQQLRLPILELLIQSKRSNYRNIFALSLLLQISLCSQTFFQFMITLPAPNYTMKNYFDWIPQNLAYLAKDKDFILQNKIQTVEKLNSLYFNIQDKLSPIALTFPIKQYNIGKEIESKKSDEIVNIFYRFSLEKHITYIPEKSTDKFDKKSNQIQYYSPQSKGYFYDYLRPKSQSKHNNSKSSFYTITGKSEIKLLLKFKGQIFNYSLVIKQGLLQINFPSSISEKIKQFMDIQVLNQGPIDISSQELKLIFKQKQDDGDKKKQQNAMNEKNQQLQAKISCKFCTFDNIITAERCVVCEHFFY